MDLEKKTNDHMMIINNIKAICAQKNQLTTNIVKDFLENISTCLNQLFLDKDTRKAQHNVLQKRIKCLEQGFLKLDTTFYHKIEKQQQKEEKIKEQPIKQIEQNKITESIIQAPKQKIKQMPKYYYKEKISQEIAKIQIKQKDIQFEMKNLQNIVNSFKRSFENTINAIALRLVQSQKSIHQISKNQALKNDDIIQRLSILEKFCLTGANWVDPKCRDFNQLVINGSIITAKKSAHVFGRRKLSGKCSFTITFNKINNVVHLGVVDSSNKAQPSFCWNKNYIWYYNDISRDEDNVGGAMRQRIGGGYTQGERVLVQVDLIQGSISWKVGSQCRHQINNPILKNVSVIWVPLIYLPNQGDSVEIIE